MKVFLAPALTFGLFSLTACDQTGVDLGSGIDGWMRTAGGTYFEGEMPAAMEADAGKPPSPIQDGGIDESVPPLVDSIQSVNNTVHPGQVNKGVQAFVSPNTRTVAYQLDGDKGYWLVPVGSESIENAPDYESSVSLNFSGATPLGARKLWIAAANANGDFGPARALDLTFTHPVPTGAMVVQLSWSDDMDLDLVLIGPDGSKLTPDGLVDKAGMQITPSDTTPFIDIDSNQACVIDGKRTENAVFTTAPKKGKYRAYVRLAQTCALPRTNWTVRVIRNGKESRRVTGTAYSFQIDTKNGGPDGPGVFATEFDVEN